MTVPDQPLDAAEEAPPPDDEAALRAAIRLAEALIFASPDPVPARRLAVLLGDAPFDADAVLAALAAATAGRGVELHEVGGGWQFRTAPDLAPLLLRVVEKPRRLPRAAMETLAVVAWDGPCTRAEIEDKRGVSLAQPTLELLIEERLLRPAGVRAVPGRPMQWDITDEFLSRFGLRSRAELPSRRDVLIDPPVGAPSPPPSGSATSNPVLDPAQDRAAPASGAARG